MFKTGFEPSQFQIRGALALLHGFDTFVISGCGTGKIMVFQLATMMEPHMIGIVVTPINILEAQVSTQLIYMRIFC